jgi:hypothetical protein
MRRINDPLALKDYLSRLTSEPLTPAQARLLLASRGVRAQKKAVEAALRMMRDPAVAPAKTRRMRFIPLDNLPLTPQERAIMERLREERRRWSAQMLQELKKKPRPGRQG